MTESALHVVDTLYYVMDYNHVQSEMNLYFLQELQRKQISFSIIINQIDKHNEAELSFEQFDFNVNQTFDQWNIFPEKIYYTSVVNEQAPYNQIKDVKADLFSLLQENKNTSGRIDLALNEIISAYKTFIKEEHEEKVNRLQQVTNNNFEIDKLLE